jgi:DNA (cytosine-5)-methyltransferase 1
MTTSTQDNNGGRADAAPRFSFIDLFAGVGGFRIPLDQLGGQCLGYAEIDKSAISVYENNFGQGDHVNLGNVAEISALPPSVDLITGGVPCQPWSVAGKRKGFEDERGQLWFDVIRLVDQAKPKAFIFENVKGLVNPSNHSHFLSIINRFEALGYSVKWKLVNSYDFGVPQNRERVFIVGLRQDLECSDSYQFPDPVPYKVCLKDVIDDLSDLSILPKVKIDPAVLFEGNPPPSRNPFQKTDELNDFFTFSDLRGGHATIHSWDLVETTAIEKELCLFLLKSRRQKRYGLKDGNPLSLRDFQEHSNDFSILVLLALVSKKILRPVDVNGIRKYDFVNSKNSSGINGIYRVFLPQSEVFSTLTATGSKDYIATQTIHADNPRDYKKLFLSQIYHPGNFRAISVQDARQLQGFPDWFQPHVNERIAKKHFGNAVSIPVVLRIAKQLVTMIAPEDSAR